MTEPTFTRHARERLAQRGITEEQVLAALRHERRRDAGQPGTLWIYGLIQGGETLKVCVTADMSTVITVAWPD